MTDLMALADRVEALICLTNADWELEDAIKRAVWQLGIKPGPFLSSLDAAMTLGDNGDKPDILHEALEAMHISGFRFDDYAGCLARAYTATALRALAAKEPA